MTDILEICVGITGIVAILVAIAGLHYRDSIGCVLFRSLRRRRVECQFRYLLHDQLY
jgi:hypothetical protein